MVRVFFNSLKMCWDRLPLLLNGEEVGWWWMAVGVNNYFDSNPNTIWCPISNKVGAAETNYTLLSWQKTIPYVRIKPLQYFYYYTSTLLCYISLFSGGWNIIITNSGWSVQRLFGWATNYRVSQKNALIKQTKMAKHGRLVNIPKWSKGVQKGQKW